MTTDLQTSERFRPPPQRRDFLGLASLGSAAAAMGFALIGALRLPMPSIFPESNSRVKLGPASKFTGVEMTAVPEHRLWVFSDSAGLYAVSAICTHLGCIVAREENGQFHCPCHGSQFDTSGKVIGGPAPKPLARLDLQVAPDGQLVVDTQKQVAADTRLEV